MHVDEFGREIGIDRRRRSPEPHADRTRHLGVSHKRRRHEYQNVCTRREGQVRVAAEVLGFFSLVIWAKGNKRSLEFAPVGEKIGGAAHSRRRVFRIVDKAGRRFVPGPRCAQRAAGMKVILRVAGTRERPIVFNAPPATVVETPVTVPEPIPSPHDKDLHRRLRQRTGLSVSQRRIEPVPLHGVVLLVAHFCVPSEVDFSRVTVPVHVCPGPHQELDPALLALGKTRVENFFAIKVIPAGHVVSRDVLVVIEELFRLPKRRLFPEIAVVGLRHHVEEPALGLGIRAERSQASLERHS